MTNKNLVAPWVRRFLLEHVVAELNLSRHTQASYRDALAFFLPFAAKVQRHAVDHLEVEHLSPDVVRSFLAHLEEIRRCSVTTRNQRLAAIHSFARFVGVRSPEHLHWCARGRRGALQEGVEGNAPVSRQARNRRAPRGAESSQSPGDPRSRAAALSVQLWRALRRGGAADRRRPRPRRLAGGEDPRQGQQGAPLPALAGDSEHPPSADRRTRRTGSRVSEPPPRSRSHASGFTPWWAGTRVRRRRMSRPSVRSASART